MISRSRCRIAALVGFSLAIPQAVSAQAYIDQVNRGEGNGAYVSQMPAGAQPVVTTKSPLKRKLSKASNTGGSSAIRAAVEQAVPSVGAGSAAIVKVSSADTEWPTVGRGAAAR